MSSRCVARLAIILCGCLAAGCGGSPYVQIATAVRSDGSVERSVWQPQAPRVLLPDDALSEAWSSRWSGGVEGVVAPPAFKDVTGPNDGISYFHATGIFKSPDQIPVHYLKTVEGHPEVPPGELVRAYHRRDYGLVVKHEWSETLTNIVTFQGFRQASEQLSAYVVPLLCQGIEEVYGNEYDVSRFLTALRPKLEQLIREGGIACYRELARKDDRTDFMVQVAPILKRAGLDLLGEDGKPVEPEAAEARVKAFMKDWIVRDVKRRDGKPITDEEIAAILQSGSTGSFYSAWGEFFRAHYEEFSRKGVPLLLKMFGHYEPMLFLSPPAPRFDVTVTMPGQVITTTGTIEGPGKVHWNLDGSRLFPSGLEMSAASIEPNRSAQTALFGKAVLVDPNEANAFCSLLDAHPALLSRVQEAIRASDPNLLFGEGGKTEAEREAISKLKAMFSGHGG